jgi:glucosamine-6-phosphate isomerase
MKIIIQPNYQDLSTAAANKVVAIMQESSNPLCCIASGDSPKGLYQELVRQHEKENLDISHWHFVGLDEWLGMNATDEGSCVHMLENELVKPLGLLPNQFCLFDGRTQNPIEECSRVEQFIQQYHGMDIAILGLGLNGHLGLNEPGTSFTARAHVSEISPSTQSVGQKYFSSETNLTKGITLGLGSLMEAKNILLVVSGEKKASIIKRVIEGEIHPDVPASILQKHPSCYVFLDKAAAQLLSKNKDAK